MDVSMSVMKEMNKSMQHHVWCKIYAMRACKTHEDDVKQKQYINLYSNVIARFYLPLTKNLHQLKSATAS